jgi:hypothetical protein
MVLGALWLAVRGQVNIVELAAMLMLHDDWSSSELQQQIEGRHHLVTDLMSSDNQIQ